jgi:hypothetical protein
MAQWAQGLVRARTGNIKWALMTSFWMGALFTLAGIGACAVIVLCALFAWLLLIRYTG